MRNQRHLFQLLLLTVSFATLPWLVKGSNSLKDGDPIDSFGEGSMMCMSVTTTTTNSSCASPTGTATANVVGGTAPYSYVWSNGQTTQTATGLGTMIYSVTVTDAFGCIQVATADIDNGGPNITNLTVNQPSCFGVNDGSASVAFSGGSGFVFAAWRVPNLVGPTTSVTGLAPGTFSVGVGDGTGCADSMIFTVAYPAQLALNFGTTHTSCGLSNGVLSANASGGTGTINYAWSNGGTTSTVSGLAAGSYAVTITDANNCTLSGNASINASTAPTVSLSSSSNPSCNGGSNGSATVAGASGTPGYTFVWSNGQTGATATNLSAGTYTVTVTDGASCTATLSVPISEPSAVSASVSTIAVGCNVGNPNGSATANPAGGTGPYTYLWSNGQTTQTATNLTVGSYSVTVTDFQGCTTTASGNVLATSTPTVTASADVDICAGSVPVQISAAAASGTGPYTFLWSCNNPPCAIDTVSDDDPAVSPTTTTTYYVQVTDAGGCTSNTDSVVITVKPLPVINAGANQTICQGDTTALAGSATGAGPLYTFSWTPGTGLSSTNIANPDAFPLFTTTYSLNVSSNGCSGVADQVTVTVNPVPTVNAGQNISTCFGNQASLTAVSAGANPVTYTWMAGSTVISANGPSSVSVSPTTTTTYSVVATSSANCSSAADSVTVTVIPFPQANAGPDYGICIGDTVDLLGSIFFLAGDTLVDQSGVTYSWSPTAGLTSPTSAQTQAVVGTSTTFTLTVAHQGCQSQNTVQVDVFPLPVAIANASDTLICSNDSLQLLSAGSSGTSIVWTPTNLLSNPSSVNPVAYPTDSTWFFLTASNGPCAVTDSIFIEVGIQPSAEFVTSDTIVCTRQVVQLDEQATGFFDLLWSISDGRTDTTDGDISHFFFQPGNYTVQLTATGELGCTDVQTFVLEVIDGPVADFVSDPPFTILQTFPGPDFNFTETANDEIEWIWRFPGDSVLVGQEVNHVFQTPGSHAVELLVIDSEGCRDSVIHTITILPNDIIPQNVFSPNGDGINDLFRIEYAGNREYTLMVFDRWGKQLFLTKDKLEGWDGKNALGLDVPEGVYFYTLWVGPDEHMTGNVTLVR